MTIFTNISQTNSGGSDIDVEKIANTDLSNLTAVGETHFANKSLSNIDALGQAKFLNKQMITNCLISATSGLVTASGNTLTVPSGLIFLIPNGVDATTSMIKNIETITSVTTTFTESSSQYGTRVLFYNSDNTLTSYLQSEIEYDNVLKYWKANGSKIVAKNLATYYWDGSDISSFIPEQVATIEMSSMGAVLDTKANVSFDNLSDSAKNIGNWSSNVSNCITKIPQDIKLELNDGVLALKAGSKLYVPNGFEQDGTTKKFVVFTCPSDLVIQSVDDMPTSQRVVLIDTNNYNWNYRYTLENCFSGDTAPTPSEVNAVWYDTTNNVIKRTSDSGNTWSTNETSFPICIFSRVQNVGVTSIDQVFNGFGYIGNIQFVTPGIDVMLPDGRYEDGSLKSIKYSIPTLIIRNYTWNIDGGQFISIKNSGEIIGSSTTNSIFYQQEDCPIVNKQWVYWYKPSTNIMYISDANFNFIKSNSAVIGIIRGDNNGKISSLEVKSVCRSDGYNEFNEHRLIRHQWPNASNNYTFYMEYSDGYVEEGIHSNTYNAFLTDTTLQPHEGINMTNKWSLPIPLEYIMHANAEVNGDSGVVAGDVLLENNGTQLSCFVHNTYDTEKVIRVSGSTGSYLHIFFFVAGMKK